MTRANILRYLGNLLLMIGYQTMLWSNFKYGLLIKFIGGTLTIPFSIKLKMWDVLFVTAFFGISELSKVIQLFFKSTI